MFKLELQVETKKFKEDKGIHIVKAHNYKDKYLNRDITIISKADIFTTVEYGDVIYLDVDFDMFTNSGLLKYDGEVEIAKLDLNSVLIQMIEKDKKLTASEISTFLKITNGNIIEFFTHNTQEFILSELRFDFNESKLSYLLYKSYELIEVYKISKLLTENEIDIKYAAEIYITLGRDAYKLLKQDLLFALRVIPLDILTDTLSEINTHGEIYMRYLEFLGQGQGYVTQDMLTDNISDLESHPMLMNVNGYYIEKYIYNKEKFIYDYLEERSNIKYECDEYHYETLSDEQNATVNNSLQNSLSVITGGPGTGKTTTIVKLIQSLEEEFAFSSIKVLASTGSAADILTEKIHDHDAKTVHSYIETLKMGAKPADIIIIDESSMLDVNVTFQFLSYLSQYDNTHLIFVGDEDQLPSVEYGYVLTNLLKFKYNVGKLTKTFRQG